MKPLESFPIGSGYAVRFSLLILCILILGGCTTVDYDELTEEKLREQIVAGKVIKSGDVATVVTSERRYDKIRIASVNNHSVVYQEMILIDGITPDEESYERQTFEIPVSAIIAVEKQEITDAGKLAAGTATVVGASAFLYFLYFIVPAALIGAAL